MPSVHQVEYVETKPSTMGRKWVIDFDYREIDVTDSKGDKILSSRTIVAADLLGSKDGSGGEIDKIEYLCYIEFADDSGSANGLDLSTATDNQHEMAVAGGSAAALPFAISGSKSGQHVSGNMECVANGGGSMVLSADVSNLGATILQEDVAQAIEHTLADAIALGNNLRLKVSSFLVVYYNLDIDLT